MQMESDNSNNKPVTMPEQNMVNYHPQNHTAMANMRRFPSQQLDPGLHTMPMYPAPAHIYPPNTCYSCLTAVPISGMQNRYSRQVFKNSSLLKNKKITILNKEKFFNRNNAPVYCITQLQALRLDPENRHCSQGSSSDSSGSRSPPETPPAIQWHESSNASPNSEQMHATPVHNVQTSQTAGSSTSKDRPQQRKTRSAHVSSRQQKSTQMVNGGTPSAQSAPQPPPNSSNMNYGPGAPAPSYMPHATHFPALRPSSGIYTSFTTAYAPRPSPSAYSTSITFQPNGDMMYQYPPATGNPPPPPSNAVGNNAPLTNSTVSSMQSPTGQQQQAFVQSAPVVFTTAPPPLHSHRQKTSPPPQLQRHQQRVSSPPPKISCYNCGSNAHLASDCKEQTMEDITRGGIEHR